MDIFFYEAFREEAACLKELIGNRLQFGMTEKTIQETGSSDPPTRLISIRTQSVIPADWANKIDGVLSRSTGYDHLKKYLDTIRAPLPCGYLEEYSTRAVAEQAILLMMALIRRLTLQIGRFRNFERDGLTGGECAGRNLLVVGVGRIGSEISRIAAGLGMNVYGVDIVQGKADVQYVEKEKGVRLADVIICSMNLTPENHAYFSYGLLKQARKGVLFVNIARGEHSPLADLERLLKEGHLGGIGLDVFEDEANIAVAMRSGKAGGPAKGGIIDSLLRHPNVILTPHNAFNTMEAVRRKSQFTVDEVLFFLKNGIFRTAVR
jgi:D-lactate dehydrogenase